MLCNLNLNLVCVCYLNFDVWGVQNTNIRKTCNILNTILALIIYYKWIYSEKNIKYIIEFCNKIR